MSILAEIRPDSWDLPLFLHVLGAMILVGATLSSVAALGYARGDERLLRLGYWTLLIVGLPAYVVMRIGAEWLAEREGFHDAGAAEPTWIDIGYAVADIGLLVFVIALIAGGFGVRRLRSGKGTRLLKTTLVLAALLLVAYVVTIWAMSGKPG